MDAIRHWFAPGALSGTDVVRYAATVSVWGRWFIWLVGVFLLAHRPGFWYPGDIEFLAIPVLLGALNGLVHHLLLTNRPVTWRWMLFLSAADIALSGRPRVNPSLRPPWQRRLSGASHFNTICPSGFTSSSGWLELAKTPVRDH